MHPFRSAGYEFRHPILSYANDSALNESSHIVFREKERKTDDETLDQIITERAVH